MESKGKILDYLKSRNLEVCTVQNSPSLKVYHPMNENLKLCITINFDHSFDLSLYVRSQYYMNLLRVSSYEELRFEICKFEASCVFSLVGDSAELDIMYAEMYENMVYNCDLGN